MIYNIVYIICVIESHALYEFIKEKGTSEFNF